MTDMVAVDAGDTLGPAMLALTDQQRAFVKAAIDYPLALRGEWAKRAGYSDHMDRARITAHELLRKEKILAALQEEAAKQVRLGGVVGITGLIEIAQEKDHPDRFKALVALADRGGFGAKTEHKVTVEHVNEGRMVELAARFAAEFRLGHTKLIGGNVIEGKAEEVVVESTPD